MNQGSEWNESAGRREQLPRHAAEDISRWGCSSKILATAVVFAAFLAYAGVDEAYQGVGYGGGAASCNAPACTERIDRHINSGTAKSCDEEGQYGRNDLCVMCLC